MVGTVVLVLMGGLLMRSVMMRSVLMRGLLMSGLLVLGRRLSGPLLWCWRPIVMMRLGVHLFALVILNLLHRLFVSLICIGLVLRITPAGYQAELTVLVCEEPQHSQYTHSHVECYREIAG